MGVTPDQLIQASNIEADDLFVTWRASGPLKSFPASGLLDYIGGNKLDLDGDNVGGSAPTLLANIGALGSANNLSDLNNADTARTNIGAVGSAELADDTGSDLVGYRQNMLAMTVSAALNSGPIYASRAGLVAGGSGSASANVTKINAAIEFARTEQRGAFVNDVDNFYLDQNIVVPTGADNAVRLTGYGEDGPRIWFTGSAVTKGFDITGPNTGGTYAYAGGVFGMNIIGTSGAKRGITCRDLNHPVIMDCQVRQFDGAGIYIDGCIMPFVGLSRLFGCGNASEHGLVVTGDQAEGSGVGSVTTHFMWLHNRINGALGAGATTKIGGLAIDAVQGYKVIGGNIESTGQPISIANKTAATRGCTNGLIQAIGMENPGNGNALIDVGRGWTGGGTGAGVINLVLMSVNASPSGTTSGTHALRAENLSGLEVIACRMGLAAGATSAFEFVGTTNTRNVVRACGGSYGDTLPWVRVNSAQEPLATPLRDWNQSSPELIQSSITVTGATPSISPLASQGGAHNVVRPNNGSATNMTNMTPIATSKIVTMMATNGNTTIKHLAGGTGQFSLTAAVDLVMTANKPYQFIGNPGTGHWTQIGS